MIETTKLSNDLKELLNDNSPHIKMALVDQVWAKQMHFLKIGFEMQGHKHLHNHMTLLAKGSLNVIVENESKIFKAPTIIVIEKDKMHKLIALEDDTIAYCIHASRDFDTGDIIDDDMLIKNPNAKKEPLAKD